MDETERTPPQESALSFVLTTGQWLHSRTSTTSAEAQSGTLSPRRLGLLARSPAIGKVSCAPAKEALATSLLCEPFTLQRCRKAQES